MGIRIGNFTMYGMSEVRDGYSIYFTDKLSDVRRDVVRSAKRMEVADSITRARSIAVRTLVAYPNLYAPIYKGEDSRAQGCCYMDGRIPCWINESMCYIVNGDGSIRNGMRYR